MAFQKTIAGYNDSLVQLGSAAALVHELDLDWMEKISESFLGEFADVAIESNPDMSDEQRKLMRDTADAIRRLICAGNVFNKALPELLFQEGTIDDLVSDLADV
jgi:hypothetical protein